jgi:hypothetical protein
MAAKMMMLVLAVAALAISCDAAAARRKAMEEIPCCLTNGQLANLVNITYPLEQNATRLGNQYGTLQTMDAQNFPAIIPTGISFALLTFQPCTYLSPHIHPRGNEMEYTYQGSNVSAIQVPENSMDPANYWPLPVGYFAIYPQATVHTQINMGCDVAKIFVIFDNADPGLVFFPLGQVQLPFLMVNEQLSGIGLNMTSLFANFTEAGENYAKYGAEYIGVQSFRPLPAELCGCSK